MQHGKKGRNAVETQYENVRTALVVSLDRMLLVGAEEKEIPLAHKCGSTVYIIENRAFIDVDKFPEFVFFARINIVYGQFKIFDRHDVFDLYDVFNRMFIIFFQDDPIILQKFDLSICMR